MPALNIDLSSLQTEQRNPRTTDIDVVSTVDLCRIINKEDQSVPQAVEQHIETIAKIVDELSSRVLEGGRVVYLGAGTSGRLGVLDASEIPPTYSAPQGLFIGLIAGGDYALRNSIEGAEDSPSLGASTINDISPPLTPLDSVVGLAASGRTPWVLGGLARAKEIGCYTAGVACVSPSKLGTDGYCQDVVDCVVGGEVVTGSTRMKSGTATKLILNMISTGVMIRIGKTYGNLMVDVKTANQKLIVRARGILRSVVESVQAPLLLVQKGFDLKDDAAVDKLIADCGGVKAAVVVLRWGCSPNEAQERLGKVHGVLRRAIEA